MKQQNPDTDDVLWNSNGIHSIISTDLQLFGLNASEMNGIEKYR